MTDDKVIRFPTPYQLTVEEMIENDEITSCCDFIAEIITDLMTSNTATGDTIATSLCMLAHDILRGQQMTDIEIQAFVDEIFPRSGFRFDFDE